jgi:hypothetical protein
MKVELKDESGEARGQAMKYEIISMTAYFAVTPLARLRDARAFRRIWRCSLEPLGPRAEKPTSLCRKGLLLSIQN